MFRMIATTALAVVMAGPAAATVFTDRAAFETHVVLAGVYETFDGLGPIIDDYVALDIADDAVATGAVFDYAPGESAGSAWALSAPAAAYMRIDLRAGASAFGLDLLNQAASMITGAETLRYRVDIYTPGSLAPEESADIAVTGAGAFLGFTRDSALAAIMRVDVWAYVAAAATDPTAAVTQQIEVVDNLTAAGFIDPTVPVPAAAPLLLGALGALGLARRRG